VLIALDGRSGAGKSTLARQVGARVGALAIDGDDFYLLDVDRDVRRARLLRREGERYRAEWEARWEQAEDLYFDVLMPSVAFDLVLDGN
jgi:cytidylate kinase